MTHSKGISWIDDCRIPTDDKLRKLDGTFTFNSGNGADMKGKKNAFVEAGLGRFPANLLVCDDMLNDGNVIQYNKNRTDNGTYLGGHRKEYVGTDDNDVVKQIKGQFFNDKGTNSRYYDIDKWFDKIINYE